MLEVVSDKLIGLAVLIVLVGTVANNRLRQIDIDRF